MPRTDRNQSAFTLVETLIATAILILGVYALYDQFIRTRDVSRAHQRQMQLQWLGRQRLEEIRAMPFTSLAETIPTKRNDSVKMTDETTANSNITYEGQAMHITVEVFPTSSDIETSRKSGRVVTVRGMRCP